MKKVLKPVTELDVFGYLLKTSFIDLKIENEDQNLKNIFYMKRQ